MIAYLIGTMNLLIGFAIGCLVGRARRPPARPKGVHELAIDVAGLLSEIDGTIAQRSESWAALRELLMQETASSRRGLGVHVDSNRLFAQLLRTYAQRLEQGNPNHNGVSDELLIQIADIHQDADALADELDPQGPRPADVNGLLQRLEGLEQSNQTLRSELHAVQRQISEQSQQLQEAETAAYHDVLTGIANRRAFEERIRKLETRFEQEGRPYALLLFDLDRFKTINDTWGHDAGDAALQVVAHVMQQGCRSGDHLSRLGGEEFAVLAAETNLTAAVKLADRIRRLVEQASLNHNAQRITVTCSVGVAEARPNRTRDELLRAADGAMYHAKQAGRNRVSSEADVAALPASSAVSQPATATADDESQLLQAVRSEIATLNDDVRDSAPETASSID